MATVLYLNSSGEFARVVAEGVVTDASSSRPRLRPNAFGMDFMLFEVIILTMSRVFLLQEFVCMVFQQPACEKYWKRFGQLAIIIHEVVRGI